MEHFEGSNFRLCPAEKFRFSAEFIEMRRQALDMFVNRIASHHELQQSDDLRTFLQADEQVAKLMPNLVIFLLLLQVNLRLQACLSASLKESKSD